MLDANVQSAIPNPQSSMRFVIPIVAGIGNALMAVPMVRQVKRSFPNARITILARISAMGEPFRRLPEVDEVIVTGKGVKGLLKLIRESRSRRPDVYLVPFPSNRWEYSMLALTSGAKRRLLHRYPVGKFRALGFIGERIDAIRGIHDVEQNLRLLMMLGIELHQIESPHFPITAEERRRADQLLEGGHLFIAIHAGSARTVLAEAKRWGADNYAKLIGQLRAEFEEEIVILEGPDEVGVSDEILSALPLQRHGVRVLKLAGPLGEAAAVLERATLYVGTDSGLAHLAAAVGKRAVTIFAPADPSRVCPFGQGDLVVKPAKACSPCFLYPWEKTKPAMRCREPFCIREVTVEMVMDAVRRTGSLVPNSEKGVGRGASIQ